MYDAIIIGAGISGLVCGCYLAKAGMKVLVCEQHYKPGGYCTSFKKHGFTFDTAAHCFGGYRKGGMTRKIFEDLEIDKKIKIIRFNPILFGIKYAISA
jgi:phytoene dehydrogenase-like protein